MEANSGSSTMEFNWIAIGNRKVRHTPPAEVIAKDYTDKMDRGLTNDANTNHDAEGVYFRDGDLILGKCEAMLPNEQLIAVKEEFVRNPGSKSFETWRRLMEDAGGQFITEREYDELVKNHNGGEGRGKEDSSQNKER
jgi:hypothetical protein